MKFSFLLPTRNGAAMLADCVAAALAQDYDDMELVVSDNASTDATPDILDSFRNDPRLKVTRLSEPVDVTDNWNNALRVSSGDYILLFGDDDYVLPDYCNTMSGLLREYSDPACVTYNAYGYAFPDSLADHPESHYAETYYEWSPDLPTEAPLSRDLRVQIVRDLFDFNFRVHLNLQTTLVSRRAIERLSNGFLRRPFPDFYGLNALMLRAETWVYVPVKPVVIGISPKSFGHTVHGHDVGEGLDYLGHAPRFPGYVPGNEVINGTYAVLVELARDYPAELAGCEVDRTQYVFNQVYSWYVHWRIGSLPRRVVTKRLRDLAPRDYLHTLRGVARNFSFEKVRRNIGLDESSATELLWPHLTPLPEVHSIAEFARWLAREPVSQAAGDQQT